MKITYGLTLPTEVQSVPTARAICTANLALLKVSQDSIDDVALALTEACANVVKHAGGHGYEVLVSISADLCRIEVVDNGAGFDPDGTAEPDPEEILPSGRGLMLMEALVDTLAFTRRDGAGTVVTLEKRLVLAADSPLHQLSTT